MQRTHDRLFFYTAEVRHAIGQLDGLRLPQRTLSDWLTSGLVDASLRWLDGERREGIAARGTGRNACRFTVDDFQHVRLVAQLRYRFRLSVSEIRDVIDRLGPELRRILRGKSAAVLVLDADSRSVRLERRDGTGPALDVRAGQYMLNLKPLTEGNEAAARKARDVA